VFERKKGGSSSGKPQKKTGDDYIAGHQVGEMDLYGHGIVKLSRAVSADKYDFAARFDGKEMADERVDLWFHYPILVTSGPLFECVTDSRAPVYKRVHRVGFLHRGADIPGEIADCRLDVVDPTGLRNLLEIIDTEIDRIVGVIRRRYGLLAYSRGVFARRYKLSRMKTAQRIRVVAGETIPELANGRLH
jgi:hypothetical protein